MASRRRRRRATAGASAWGATKRRGRRWRAARAAGGEGGEVGLFVGPGGRAYVLPHLSARVYSRWDDLAFVAMTLVLLLPSLAVCADFLRRCSVLAACLLRHRRSRLGPASLVAILALQGALLLPWSLLAPPSFLHVVGALAALVAPLALPACAAANLLTSTARRAAARRHHRASLAVLTLAPPLLWLCELRRLRAGPPVVVGAAGGLLDAWLAWLGLCPAYAAGASCGAH